MPGVLLIEMHGADGGLDAVATIIAGAAVLAAVKEAKIRAFVGPGPETHRPKQKLVHEGSGYAMTEASFTSEGKPVCDAALTFRLTPYPESAFRDQDREADEARPAE